MYYLIIPKKIAIPNKILRKNFDLFSRLTFFFGGVPISSSNWSKFSVWYVKNTIPF